MEKEKVLLIVDGNSLLYRGFYGLPLLSNADGIYTNAVYGFCNIMIKIITELKPNYILVAFDYAKKTFRNDLYSEYKANRKPTPEELKMQFPIIKEILKKMNITVVECEGYEGDDIIGTMSKRFKEKTIILTGDRDSLQLIDESTEVWLNKKGITDIDYMNEQTFKEKYGVTPTEFICVKALMGDTSDNIKGVAGIGEKGAYKLVSEYSTLDNLYSNLDNLPAKMREKLLLGKDDAYLSYKLATIKTDCDIPLNIEDCVYDFPFNNEVYTLMKKYDFKSLTKNATLFTERKIEIANKIEVEEINNLKSVEDLVKELENQPQFAFDVEEGNISVCYDGKKVYKINFCADLFSLELTKEKVLSLMKEVLQDKNKEKIIFNYKVLLNVMTENHIKLTNVFDTAIAYYLLEANEREIDKQIFTSKNGCQELVQAMLLSKDELMENMIKKGLYNLYKTIELPLAKCLFTMEQNGVKIDEDKLNEFDKKYSSELIEIEKSIYKVSGEEFNINSPKQMAEILFDKLGLPLIQNKKRSTGVEELEKIIEYHEIVPLILRYRKVMKLKTTYIDAYKKFVKDGFIHTTFNQLVTGTGRLSSKDPNLQNIPIRDGEVKNIREIFVSRFENGELLSFDYSQIELKLMAHFSGDEEMINAFNSGVDIHRQTASKVFKVPFDEVTKEQRQYAKSVNFGIIYGQGAYGLSKNIGTSVKQASEFIESYFKIFPKVKEFMDEQIIKAKQNNNYAVTMFGRIRNIPELSADNANLRAFGERVAINMPLQGSASDIIKLAMVQINDEILSKNLRTKMILQIHDELIFDCPQNEIEEIEVLVKDKMENVVKLNVPLNVEISKSLMK